MANEGESALKEEATRLLRQMLGPRAEFRDGQWEAIEALVAARQRVLVVQRTGWGKSLVYFLATKLLRDRRAGPTLLISPLLSLMRNQIAMAERISVRAETINSTNAEEWDKVRRALAAEQVDILLVSPERLGNEEFLTSVLQSLGGRIGLFVVDEVHCISDWGHDFRPDYRRILRIVRALPANVPVLGTTATANDRVLEDVTTQFGHGLTVQRGPLARASLRLQCLRLPGQSERLAWLAQWLPNLPGSGIVYCLTVADADRVARWLSQCGSTARAYHADLPSEERVQLEEDLLGNRVKALVATVALGMGFDKPDLGFVVHYQRPGSVVAYYQQVGRAGRAVENAYGILLSGEEDDDIQGYFLRTAFPPASTMEEVLAALATNEGLTLRGLQANVNSSHGTLERALKLLEIDGAIARSGSTYFRTPNPWVPDEERIRRVTEQRQAELRQMRQYVAHSGCLMEFLARALDDPTATPCGRCANCRGAGIPANVWPELVAQADQFLRASPLVIAPRKQWPAGKAIKSDCQCEEGRALSIYGDAGWGREVKRAKYETGRFGAELVEAAAAHVRQWQPTPSPTWVTAIPSLRHPDLVPDFAKRLAAALSLPYEQVLRKTRETQPQKAMANSAYQEKNVRQALALLAPCPPGPVLLVDDIVDSRWTMAVVGSILREHGSGPVFPFALACAAGRDR